MYISPFLNRGPFLEQKMGNCGSSRAGEFEIQLEVSPPEFKRNFSISLNSLIHSRRRTAVRQIAANAISRVLLLSQVWRIFILSYSSFEHTLLVRNPTCFLLTQKKRENPVRMFATTRYSLWRRHLSVCPLYFVFFANHRFPVVNNRVIAELFLQISELDRSIGGKEKKRGNCEMWHLFFLFRSV